MILVHTSQDRILIDRIKQSLLQNDIYCFVRNENPVGQAAGEVPPLFCWPEIYVKTEDHFKKAKQLIEKLMPSQKQSNLKWICPQCSETIEPQFKQCWSCLMSRETV